jgi:hypothetical protein
MDRYPEHVFAVTQSRPATVPLIVTCRNKFVDLYVPPLFALIIELLCKVSRTIKNISVGDIQGINCTN